MKGRCSCGKVSFEITQPTQGIYYCHCRDCQRHSGSAFQILAVVSKHGLNRFGDTHSFGNSAHGGFTMTREFCANCGSPLFLNSSQWDDIIMFSVAALDDPDTLKPEFQIWKSSEINWATIPEGIDSYPRGALDGK